MNLRLRPWAGFLLLIVLTGCGTARVEVHKMPTPFDFPRSAAVLPFTFEESLPKDQHPNFLLREIFFNHFSYLGYTDLAPAEVDRRLKKAGYDIPPPPAPLDYKELRRILNVDAVVRGHLLEANNFTGGIYSETRIRARLEMIDLNSGDILWETEHHEFTTSGITNLSLVDLIKDQVENYHTYEAFYRVAEMFAIKVIDRLPDPAEFRELELRLPRIYWLEANLQPGQTLTPYDILRVQLTGDPGLTATFDIGNFHTGIAMEEETAGNYTGVYQVLPEDKIIASRIIGRLQNKEGLVSIKVSPIPATTEPIANPILDKPNETVSSRRTRSAEITHSN